MKSALEFFERHPEQELRIEDPSQRIKISGKVKALYEMDLCSKFLWETELELGGGTLSLSLTFHDEFLGVHLILKQDTPPNAQISMPLEIPYHRLILKVQN